MDGTGKKMENSERIDNLNDIYDSLLETYFYDPNFKADLDDILAAITARIEAIKNGQKNRV